MTKRPMVIITICYILGIIWGIYLKKYIPFLFVFFVISNLSLWIEKRRGLKVKIFIGICSIVIVTTCILIKAKDDSFKDFQVNNNEINGIATVENVLKESNYYRNYEIKVHGYNKKFILRVKKNSAKLECGNVIAIKGTYEKGEVSRNYKGYSYFDHLKAKNIYGIITCEKIKIESKKSTNVGKMWISQFREKVKNNLKIILTEENAPIAMALLIGDSSEIIEDEKEMFSNANLSHILAISGMHVSYVILGLSYLLKYFGKRESKYVFILALVVFAFVTGSSPSVVRAVVMSILTLVASLVYRKSDTINNIAISALLILIFNPYNLFNLGFQLSFLGTLGIVLFHSRINLKLINLCESSRWMLIHRISKYDKFRSILKIISVSLSANILIVPILMYSFNSISFVFLISNLLVTPILGILIFHGYLTVFSSVVSMKITKFIGIGLNFSIVLFRKIAEFSSNIKFLKLQIGTPKLYTIVFIYISVFLVFMKNRIYKKRIIALLIVISIILKVINLDFNDFKIHLVDVGQGDCTLIITPSNKRILIDGGGSESSDYDVGKKVLVPYLLDRQITNIDYIIFSHFDSDHCKGLFSVIEELKVKTAIISEQKKVSENYKFFRNLASKNGVKVLVIKAGDRLNIDKSSRIEFLWPLSGKNQIQQNPLNNNSIVCKLYCKNTSILFTGDIEEIAEKELVSKYGNRLKSDVLKVAHHGSKTSTSIDFLQCVKPKIALIGVGKNNKFGHPNDEVIERLNIVRCNGI